MRQKTDHAPILYTKKHTATKSYQEKILVSWLRRCAHAGLVKTIFFRRQKKQKKPVVIFSANSERLSLLGDVVRSFQYILARYTLATATVISVALLVFGAINLAYEEVFRDLPDAQLLNSSSPVVSTKILDRNGVVLFRLFDGENRSIVPLSAVPKHVVFATIAIEDKEFYDHFGFSISGIIRAFFSNITNESIQGGSTITQQLVKNRLLTPERTLTRKIKELLLSIAVEHYYDKNKILELYLNQVSYGGDTYGIEEAAQKYFGKSVQNLTLAEAALLAGLPQAPSVYSPFGSNPELASSRQREVLRRMVEDGYISTEQAESASKETLHFRDDVIDIKAPHFVMYIKQLLAQQYGEELLYQGGLEVRTTLDLTTQLEAQKVVSDEIASLKRLKVTNAAALITNPQTGEVLSMVGSTNYFDFEHDGQVNVALRSRQPGSSIKPLTYALAFEQGFSPGTLVVDAPTTYAVPGSPAYSPQNYDGTFHGVVTLREALASSYNVPAVKTLAHIGVSALIDKAQSLGFTTWDDRKRFGLSLTLGGGEVLMTEMSQLYGAFANQGSLVPLNPILEITTHKGESLYRNTCALEQKNCTEIRAFDPRVAYMITSVLSDNTARTPAFGPLSTLVIPNQEVAVKTGTTNNLRDNWTFGYTSDKVVAVWVGNNDNTPMSYIASGVTGASSIWNKLMRAQLSAAAPHRFIKPSGLEEIQLCRTVTTQTDQIAVESRAEPRSSKTDLFLSNLLPANNKLGFSNQTKCIPSAYRFIPEAPRTAVRNFIGAQY